MKIACLADTHFGIKSNKQEFLDTQLDYLKNEFIEHIKANNIRTIIHLGDIMDPRKLVSVLTIQRVKEEFFDLLEGHVDNFYWILGNHDVYYKNTNRVNVSKMFAEYGFIRVVEHTPLEVAFENVKTILVPWISADNEETCLSQMQNTTATHVFGHFEINGFQMTKSQRADHGLTKDVFKGFEGVYSGHFHIPSEWYLGTPFQLTWDDYDSSRGFYVFDTETRDMEFHKNPKENFVVFEYEDEDLSIDAIEEMDMSYFERAYVRIEPKERSKMEVFDYFLKRVEEVAFDVKVVETGMARVEEDLDVEASQSTLSLIQSYVRAVEDEDTKLEPLMTDLYQTAISV